MGPSRGNNIVTSQDLREFLGGLTIYPMFRINELLKPTLTFQTYVTPLAAKYYPSKVIHSEYNFLDKQLFTYNNFYVSGAKLTNYYLC